MRLQKPYYPIHSENKVRRKGNYFGNLTMRMYLFQNGKLIQVVGVDTAYVYK